MAFSKSFIHYINTQSRSKIKGGFKRDSFLEIWIVEVNDRLFARSWNKSERSWFSAILEEGYGEIAYGDDVVKIKGTQIPFNSPLHNEINSAYRSKYTQPQNIPYVEGITKEEYNGFTMEFIPWS